MVKMSHFLLIFTHFQLVLFDSIRTCLHVTSCKTITSLISVLKFSPVQFFALFECNQAKTSCLSFQNWLDWTKTKTNQFKMILQPVATSCNLSFGQLVFLQGNWSKPHLAKQTKEHIGAQQNAGMCIYGEHQFEHMLGYMASIFNQPMTQLSIPEYATSHKSYDCSLMSCLFILTFVYSLFAHTFELI